jgi:hypothetical protein
MEIGSGDVCVWTVNWLHDVGDEKFFPDCALSDYSSSYRLPRVGFSAKLTAVYYDSSPDGVDDVGSDAGIGGVKMRCVEVAWMWIVVP